MKTYLQWRENFSASNVTSGARGDKDAYGDLAASGLQDIVDALRKIAAENPQSYNFIVAKIRSEIQNIDPSAGSAVGTAGRRYGSAVAGQVSSNNSQQTGAVS